MKNKKASTAAAIVVAILVFVLGGIFLASNPNLLTQVLDVPGGNLSITTEDGRTIPYGIEEETEDFLYALVSFADDFSQPTSITITENSGPNYYVGTAFEPLSPGLEAIEQENGITIFFDPELMPVQAFVAINVFRRADDGLDKEIFVELNIANEPSIAFTEEPVSEVTFETIEEEPPEELLSEIYDPEVLDIREGIFNISGVKLDPQVIYESIYSDQDYLKLAGGRYFDFRYFYEIFLTQHPPMDDFRPLMNVILENFEAIGNAEMIDRDIEQLAEKLKDAYGVELSSEVYYLSILQGTDVLEGTAVNRIVNWRRIIDAVELEKPQSDENFLDIITLLTKIALDEDVEDDTIPPPDLGDEDTIGAPLIGVGAEILPDGTTIVTEGGVVVEETPPGEVESLPGFDPIPEGTDVIGGTSFSSAPTSKACEYLFDAEQILAEMRSDIASQDNRLIEAGQYYETIEELLVAMFDEGVDPLQNFEEAEALAEELFLISPNIDTLLKKMSSQQGLIQDMIAWSEEELEERIQQGLSTADIEDCLQKLVDVQSAASDAIQEMIQIQDSANGYKDPIGQMLEDYKELLVAETISNALDDSIDTSFNENLKNILEISDEQSENLTDIIKESMGQIITDEDVLIALKGLKGEPGRNGANGLNGINGADGQDGFSGSDAICNECDPERLSQLEERVAELEQKLDELSAGNASAPTEDLIEIDPSLFKEYVDNEDFKDAVMGALGGLSIEDEIREAMMAELDTINERLATIEEEPLRSITNGSGANQPAPFDPNQLYELMQGEEFAGQFGAFFRRFVQQNGGVIINVFNNFIAGGGSIPGLSGVNCWDLDEDFIDDEEEDINGDGEYNTLDCKGPIGERGEQGVPGEAGQDGSCSTNQCEQAARSTIQENIDQSVRDEVEDKAPIIINNLLSQRGGSSSASSNTTDTSSSDEVANALAEVNRGSAPTAESNSGECAIDFADLGGLSEEELKTVYFLKCILGFIKGTQQPDGKTYLNPDGNFQREHFAQVTFRYRGTEADNFALAQQLPQRFQDVPENVWYYPAVQIADYYEYMTGIDGGDTFEPGRPLTILEVGRVITTLVSGDYPQVNDIYQRWLNTPDVEWWRAAYNTYLEVVGEPPFDISDLDRVSGGSSFTRLQVFTLVRKFYEAVNPSLATRLENEYQN